MGLHSKLLRDIYGFTTAFAVLHLSHWHYGGLHGSRHMYTGRQSRDDRHVGNKGSWVFTVNCSGIIVIIKEMAL